MKISEYFKKMRENKEYFASYIKEFSHVSMAETTIAIAKQNDDLMDHIESLKFVITDKQKQIDSLKKDIEEIKASLT